MKFSKNNDKINNKSIDKKNGLFFTNQQVSWFVSFFIVVSFFIFISGYFLGKKKAVEKFYSKIKQDSLADNIYFSMFSLYDKSNEIHVKDNGLLPIESDDVGGIAKNTKKNPSLIKKKEYNKNNNMVEKIDSCQYYAELIGFGTNKAARKFADKLLSDNISVFVKKRKSKTAHGKVITWYQVITEKFVDKSDLIALVDDVSSQERLKDVRIVSSNI